MITFKWEWQLLSTLIINITFIMFRVHDEISLWNVDDDDNVDNVDNDDGDDDDAPRWEEE